MFKKIYQDTATHMEKCADAFKKYTQTIRADRASPKILEDIQVNCNGQLKPLRQVSHIVVENARTLVVHVLDSFLVSEVKKAILDSDLRLNPFLVGTAIRVPFPPMTEERRLSLIKTIRAEAERNRVLIRKIRRDANNQLKMKLKKKIISADEDRRLHTKIQKLTEDWINNLDTTLIKKEKELMEV